MERIPNDKYTKEFRVEAVKLVTKEELSVPEAGRRLSLPPSTLASRLLTHTMSKILNNTNIEEAA